MPLAFPLIAAIQSMWARIGSVTWKSSSPDKSASLVTAFRQGLKESGVRRGVARPAAPLPAAFLAGS
jgi:hypothetical protein